MVLLHDAEDMVDPAALGLMDKALDRAEFVQIPVLPLPQQNSRWIGSHYCEKFAEAHGKTMVVRDWLSTCMPAAGVGCAFDRAMLGDMARRQVGGVPFSVDSLTEDYELGMRIEAAGGRSRFLRVRGEDGSLVATRAYFPSRIDASVRQKARWVHGIALQGWDRLGWEGGIAERWMRLRDRKGPLAALVLACGYTFFLLTDLFFILGELGIDRPWQADPLLRFLIIANMISFAWRASMRFAFTARDYGFAEGARAILRIPVANIIAIMASRRALAAYVRTLRGEVPRWDKTLHDAHPATLAEHRPQPRKVVARACKAQAGNGCAGSRSRYWYCWPLPGQASALSPGPRLSMWVGQLQQRSARSRASRFRASHRRIGRKSLCDCSHPLLRRPTAILPVGVRRCCRTLPFLRPGVIRA